MFYCSIVQLFYCSIVLLTWTHSFNLGPIIYPGPSFTWDPLLYLVPFVNLGSIVHPEPIVYLHGTHCVEESDST